MDHEDEIPWEYYDDEVLIWVSSTTPTQELGQTLFRASSMTA